MQQEPQIRVVDRPRPVGQDHRERAPDRHGQHGHHERGQQAGVDAGHVAACGEPEAPEEHHREDALEQAVALDDVQELVERRQAAHGAVDEQGNVKIERGNGGEQEIVPWYDFS